MKRGKKLQQARLLVFAVLTTTMVAIGAMPAAGQFRDLAQMIEQEAAKASLTPQNRPADADNVDRPAHSARATPDAQGDDDPWRPLPTKGPVSRPGELTFPPSVREAKQALDRFGAYRCSGCEGGVAYDSWVRHGASLLADYALEDLVGGYRFGQALSWKGQVARGEMTIVGERPIGGFPCKQVRYTLYKEQEQASRPGLFCLGKPSQYSSTNRWVEVF